MFAIEIVNPTFIITINGYSSRCPTVFEFTCLVVHYNLRWSVLIITTVFQCHVFTVLLTMSSSSSRTSKSETGRRTDRDHETIQMTYGRFRPGVGHDTPTEELRRRVLGAPPDLPHQATLETSHTQELVEREMLAAWPDVVYRDAEVSPSRRQLLPPPRRASQNTSRTTTPPTWSISLCVLYVGRWPSIMGFSYSLATFINFIYFI